MSTNPQNTGNAETEQAESEKPTPPHEMNEIHDRVLHQKWTLHPHKCSGAKCGAYKRQYTAEARNEHANKGGAKRVAYKRQYAAEARNEHANKGCFTKNCLQTRTSAAARNAWHTSGNTPQRLAMSMRTKGASPKMDFKPAQVQRREMRGIQAARNAGHTSGNTPQRLALSMRTKGASPIMAFKPAQVQRCGTRGTQAAIRHATEARNNEPANGGEMPVKSNPSRAATRIGVAPIEAEIPRARSSGARDIQTEPLGSFSSPPESEKSTCSAAGVVKAKFS
ncbi:hypothetical protein C8R46DRAFT_1037673 [Mycena filopes]|nr:hypothetical protein C8R46DRAFT_1037673 [Mycena filopes]